MYEIGSKVVYGEIGVCEILELVEKEEQEFGAEEKNAKQFYVLKPIFENGKIMVPANNPNIMLRPVISVTEAEKLIDGIPQMKIEPHEDGSVHKMVTYYKEIIHCQDCEKLLMLIVSIYLKCERLKNIKKIGQTDKKYMVKAENLLFGELSVALDADKTEIREMVKNRIDEINQIY